MSERVIDRPHSRAKYVIEKCRCAVCREGHRKYEQNRRRQRAYGRASYVNAEPARAHVRALQSAGMGWHRIAAFAGVHNSVVSKLLYGDRSRGMEPSKRVRPATAAKLLAVTAGLDVLGATVLFDATGTHRRLRALVTIGWSQAKLAARLSMEPGNFGKTIRSLRVQAVTARAVRALYDELWTVAPPEDDHRERISVSRAKNYARAHGWLPPMAWDDDQIDDPDAEPFANQDGTDVVDEVAVERCLSGRPVGRPLTPSERVLVAAKVRERGHGATRLAALLQCSGATANRLMEAAQAATATAVPA
jgi:hypothetical protein